MAFGRGTVHVSAPLTNLSLKVFNDPGDFVGDAIAPYLDVKKSTGQVYVYSKDNLRIDETIKGPGDVSKTVGRDLERVTYTTHRYGLRMGALDEDIAEADEPIASIQADDAEYIAEKLRLDYELKVYTKVSTSGNYASGLAATLTDEWDDYINGDPIGDVRTGCLAIRAECGRWPTHLALSKTDWESLKQHPDIIERYVYTGGMAAELTTQMVAKVFGIDDILVSAASRNTATEGQSDSLSDIWGEVGVLFYRGASSGKKSQHFLRTVRSQKLRTRSYREEDREVTFTDTDWKYGLEFGTINDISNKKSTAGYLISNLRT